MADSDRDQRSSCESTVRRILSIDGGGIRGAFPASLLSAFETSLGHDLTRYFDLIVGASTGGIIAAGLGMGFSAREMLGFFETHGQSLFSAQGWFSHWKTWGRAGSKAEPLRSALAEIFGQRRLGESSRRLVMPSFDLETGAVRIWKTAHHPSLVRDYKCGVVDAIMSTAGAPAHFPAYHTSAAVPLVDGAVWAYNPAAVAAVEAVGLLSWPKNDIRILSVGCTARPASLVWAAPLFKGGRYWATKVVDLLMYAQQVSANAFAEALVGRDNFMGISTVVGNRFHLDHVADVGLLRRLAEDSAHEAFADVRAKFFQDPPAEAFVPDRVPS